MYLDALDPGARGTWEADREADGRAGNQAVGPGAVAGGMLVRPKTRVWLPGEVSDFRVRQCIVRGSSWKDERSCRGGHHGAIGYIWGLWDMSLGVATAVAGCEWLGADGRVTLYVR